MSPSLLPSVKSIRVRGTIGVSVSKSAFVSAASSWLSPCFGSFEWASFPSLESVSTKHSVLGFALAIDSTFSPFFISAPLSSILSSHTEPPTLPSADTCCIISPLTTRLASPPISISSLMSFASPPIRVDLRLSLKTLSSLLADPRRCCSSAS